MTGTRVAAYLMNPAEDVILFGDQLAEGMWVLPESRTLRPGPEAGEDEQMRGQRFRRITRLRLRQAGYGPQTEFIAEWVDGHQEFHSYSANHAWLVKRDSIPGGAS